MVLQKAMLFLDRTSSVKTTDQLHSIHDTWPRYNVYFINFGKRGISPCIWTSSFCQVGRQVLVFETATPIGPNVALTHSFRGRPSSTTAFILNSVPPLASRLL